MPRDIPRTLRYDFWANHETIRALRELDASPPRAVRIMAHVAAVHDLFLSRVTGGGPVEVWPEDDVEVIEARLHQSQSRWQDVLAEASLEAPIDYVNSKGERWRSRLGEIITHVVIHSAYHRGQIALLLASTGASPPYTDYIQATRAGLI